MRLRNITGKSRILRKPKAAKTGYGCDINTRNIGRLMSIYPYPYIQLCRYPGYPKSPPSGQGEKVDRGHSCNSAFDRASTANCHADRPLSSLASGAPLMPTQQATPGSTRLSLPAPSTCTTLALDPSTGQMPDQTKRAPRVCSPVVTLPR